MSFLKNLFTEEEGQSMVEYGLIIALVVAAGVAVLTTLGTSITGGIQTAAQNIANAL